MLQPRGCKTARPLAASELRALAPRLERHLHPEPNTGCWLWDGAATITGYGQLWVRRDGRRTPLLAHRVAFALAHGSLEEGADLLHSCDTPRCCNPDHLRPGNGTQNNADMDARGRRARGQRHHNFGQPLKPKLSASIADELRQRLTAGERICDLARALNVSARTIQRIKRGEVWKPTEGARP